MGLYNYAVAGVCNINYIGALEVRDCHLPVAGKDEWGIDTLERTVKGPAHLFASFGDALEQGQEYGTTDFFLQTWRPIEHPIFPGYTLTYKGLARGIPDPLVSNQTVELISSIVADDLSVTFRGKEIIAAVQEIKYTAPQTVYRYIEVAEPSVPTYSTVGGADVQVLDSKITVTYSAESVEAVGGPSSEVLIGSAPAGVVSALAIEPEFFVIGPNSNPIVGTGLWECEDVVSMRYPSS